MKLLECQEFETLNSALQIEIGQYRKVEVRLEGYSCKMVTSDKKLFRAMHSQPGTSPKDLQPLASPSSRMRVASFSGSPSSASPVVNNLSQSLSDAESMAGNDGAEWTDAISRRTLFYLIGTLNASFYPDYDFSEASSEEFCRERDRKDVIESVDKYFETSETNKVYSDLRGSLWAAIDQQIDLKACEIYRYNPTYDPFDDESFLWFFVYLFYNKKMKRMVMFMTRAVTLSDQSIDYSTIQTKYRYPNDFDEEFEM